MTMSESDDEKKPPATKWCWIRQEATSDSDIQYEDADLTSEDDDSNEIEIENESMEDDKDDDESARHSIGKPSPNPKLKKIADHNSAGLKTAQPLRAKRLRKRPEILTYDIKGGLAASTTLEIDSTSEENEIVIEIENESMEDDSRDMINNRSYLDNKQNEDTDTTSMTLKDVDTNTNSNTNSSNTNER